MLMARRAFLSAGAALVLAPRPACADVSSRVTLSGTLEQGSLVVGRTEAGAHVVVDGTSLGLTPQGAFAFGLEYDRTKAAEFVLDYADGTSETREIVPVVRRYDIQRIAGLPEELVSPPPEESERIERENEMIFKVRALDTGGNSFADPFDWPAAGIVSGVFGSRRILNGKPKAPHLGIDIAAPDGTPIQAPADAVVSLAEPDFYLTGGTSVLDHGCGVSTTYLHQSALKVSAGDKVKRGQLIGLIGQKGRATGPHLHWAMNWFQVRLDPSRSTRTPEPPKL